MINFALFKKEFISSMKLFVLFAAILSLYIVSVVYMFDPEMGETLNKFSQMMPEVMAAFGMSDFGRTMIEFLSTYLYSFLLLIIPLIYIILLANKLVIGYIDNGSMAYLLTTPNTRTKIVRTQAFVLISIVFLLVVFVTAAVIISSELIFSKELDIGKFVWLNVGLFALHFALSGFCFFISSSSVDAKRAYLWNIGVPVVFYLIEALGNMGGKLENLQYFTIFYLFAPEKMIVGDESVYWMLTVLFSIGLIFYVVAIRVFVKRDLYL